MATLKASTFTYLQPSLISSINPTILTKKPILQFPSTQQKTSSLPLFQCKKAPNFRIFTATSPIAPSTDESLPIDHPEIETKKEDEKFDWYAHWYPVVPVVDLDKRRPIGKKVIGIDIVIWWDKNDNEWKVFEDSCPHRMAPLSEGRIDQQGRLQCVYHGWCFGGKGDCKFIPQAPRDGPPVHTSKRACVAVYPSCVVNGILWFWPNSDPEFKDIYSKKKPYYIPELDDPSYTNTTMCRDIPYGYEVLIENVMDPAHVPYAHLGILRTEEMPESLKADREGGGPLEISIQKMDINGITAKLAYGDNYFIPPCLFYGYYGLPTDSTSSTSPKLGISPRILPNKQAVLIFYCIPVSPGNSRVIFASIRNFAVWVEKILPSWIFHIEQNLVVDSDLYLLRIEEQKFMDVGPINWHKSCYVPTKSDAIVVSFRRWLNKYGGTQVDWGTKFSGLLPPIPSREQLFDRYWSHTVNCSSCNGAYKGLNALEIALQVISVASIGTAAAFKWGMISVAGRCGLVAMAVLSFVASKWLSQFVYKTFRYHDYDHALR